MVQVGETFDFHPWDSETEVGEFLAKLIELHGCKTALEIGIFRGITTMQLINKVKGGYTGVDLEDHRLDFVKKQFEDTGAWFIQNDSLTVLKAFVNEQRHYDFIFIDSFHSYEQVSQEFALCKNIINKNGLIGFHDSILHEGVKRFIDELKVRQKELNIEVITFNTPDVEGRGGASGISIVKFC
jgi:predicted O-methyltransferase YrrM